MTNQPKVAVVMTAYNEEIKWIRQSIESILNQTYSNIHLYVLLDNPENHQLENVIREYELKDSRVTFMVNERNLGRVSSLNKLIDTVTEEYVAIMDADDISCLNKLQVEIEFMEKEQLDFVSCSLDYIKNDCLEPGPQVPTLLPEHIRKCAGYGNYTPHSTWIVKKQVYDDLGGYREVTHCEDFDFVLRALQKGYKVGRLKDVLLHYRIRTSGITLSHNYEQFEKARVLRKQYRSNKLIQEIDVEELNGRIDGCSESKRKKFDRAKDKVDAFAIELYKGNYIACLGNAICGILTDAVYRDIFFETLKNNRSTNKIFSGLRNNE